MSGHDSHTVVTTRGWFQRLKDALFGVLTGLALIVAAFVLLWWNEGRAVKTAKGLAEGASAVISVSAETVAADNDGRLVHVSGPAAARENVRDPVLGIDERAIALIREVEMYQWQERSKTEKRIRVGGREERVTTYSYHSDWSGRTVDSSRFNDSSYRNPPDFPVPAETFRAGEVALGAFRLNPALIGQIGNAEPYPLTAAHAEGLPERLRGKADDSRPGWLYFGDADAPRVGDLRVRAKIIRDQAVSLVAQQNGNTFEPWTSVRGTTVQRLVGGSVSADAMFEQMQRSNRMMTWVLRALGLFMMIGGIGMVFNPLKVVFDVLPLLGALAGLATGLISGVLGLVLSLLTIAFAWLFYRPLLSIVLIALCAAVYFWARRLAAAKRTAAADSNARPSPTP